MIQEGCFKLSNSYKDKKKIIVDGKEVVLTYDKQQIKIITDFFNEVFHKKERKKLQKWECLNFCRRNKNINKLKNKKCPGMHNLNTELIKHGPYIIDAGIAEIFNNFAETGQHPEYIKEGILVPLLKLEKSLDLLVISDLSYVYQFSETSL